MGLAAEDDVSVILISYVIRGQDALRKVNFYIENFFVNRNQKRGHEYVYAYTKSRAYFDAECFTCNTYVTLID